MIFSPLVSPREYNDFGLQKQPNKKDYKPASHLIPANVPDRLQKQIGYKNGYKNIYTLRERETKREG